MTEQERKQRRTERKQRNQERKQRLAQSKLDSAKRNVELALALARPALLPDMFPGVSAKLENLFGKPTPKKYRSSKNDGVELHFAIAIRQLLSCYKIS
tara:strand:+ start:467 stop:760 length:294 start_codon:yes stop_codon:yes gene_type:complete